MAKRILSLLLLSVTFLAFPQVVSAESAVRIIEIDNREVSVTITGSTLYVTGANGMSLQIFNVAGVQVMNIKVEGSNKRYELNLPKGCYIVKIGKVVRKISIH